MADDSARAVVIRGLRDAALAHEQGRLCDIGDGWDEAAAAADGDPDLSIAPRLWEGWADSAEHGWLYYEGMAADDWPRCADRLLECLELQRAITDPDLLQRFTPRLPRSSLFTRLFARARVCLRAAT